MKLKYNNSILEIKEKSFGKDFISDILKAIMLIFALMIFIDIVGDTISRSIYNIIDPSAVNAKENDDRLMILSLISQIYIILAGLFVTMKFQKRNLKSLGIRKERFFKDYLIGIIVGIGFLFLVLLICLIFKDVTIKTYPNISIKLLFFFTIGWMIQGFSEEFICRSILMNYFARRKSVIFGIILNSIIFAAMHLGNDSISAIAIFNLFIVGVMLSLVFYVTDSIWMAASIHSFWNMAQGNIFGVAVSGNPVSKTRLFTTTFNQETIFNGGKFGLEGGLSCTIVMVLIIILLIYIIKKKDLIVKE